MSLFFDLSTFESSKKDKQFVSSSLKKFSKSPLCKISDKDLQTAKKKWKEITKSHSNIFLFAFGGTGSTKKILSSLLTKKSKNILLIDDVNKNFLNMLSSLKKLELTNSHFLFFSKSGRTEEILFYMSLLKKIYQKAKLPLKKRLTIISQSDNNPLAKWGKKEGGAFILSESPLPGRFSFFNLTGLLQSQAYTPYFKITHFRNSDQMEKALQFFIHYKKKKEIYLCSFKPQLKAISHWLELSWSESLFKKETVQQPPLLRHITLSDLRHAYIQELLTKKNQVCFWGLDIKNKEETRGISIEKMKKLLQKNKIPYILMSLSLNKKSLPCDLMRALYQILFLMGEASKANIYTQPWVDYLKKI